MADVLINEESRVLITFVDQLEAATDDPTVSNALSSKYSVV